MEWISATALMVIAVMLIVIALTLNDLTRALIEFINAPRTSLNITLCQEDRDLLREIRWHRVKKETV